jgi:hypothetical protein
MTRMIPRPHPNDGACWFKYEERDACFHEERYLASRASNTALPELRVVFTPSTPAVSWSRRAEARNQGEHLCCQLEKLMREHADKLTDTDRQPLTRAIERVREAARGEDAAAIKSAIDQLEQASHAFSQSLYAKAGPQTTSQPESPAGDRGGPDEPIDAEFEVKH